jgi:hypothetical protein
MASDQAPKAQRAWRHRPTEQVRETLKMLCYLVWHKEPPQGAHVWSIPTDEARDFDCILYDVLAERDALRAERARVIQALGLPQDIADGADLVLAAREIHQAWTAAVEDSGRLDTTLRRTRLYLSCVCPESEVALPWPGKHYEDCIVREVRGLVGDENE